MNGEFYCAQCDLLYYLRCMPPMDDIGDDTCNVDEGYADEIDASPDYCPFCGGAAEES